MKLKETFLGNNVVISYRLEREEGKKKNTIFTFYDNFNPKV